MTPERYARLTSVLDRRQPDLTVVLDNVHKPHNFSAIIRTCDAVGVARVHGVWTHSKLRPTNHTSGGSRKWVSVQPHATLAHAVVHLKEQEFTIYAAHLSGSASDYRSHDYSRPCAIVLGAELTGLSEQGATLADHHIVIPMNGMVQSLNVSVAAAVILFEAQRQRIEAGLYDSPRLDAAERARILFEWLHPDVARYCRSRAIDYPELDEHGEIVELQL